MADKNPIGHSVKDGNGGDVHTVGPCSGDGAGTGRAR